MSPDFKKKPAILGGVPAFRALLPITRPTLPLPAPLLSKVKKSLKSGMITNGHYVCQFEEKIKKYLKVKHVVAVNNCTSGLMMVLKVLNIKGKVLVPSFTFCATGHAIVWAGLEPVFLECDPHTLTLDPGHIRKRLGPDVGAVLAVHMFGNPANVDELQSLVRKRKTRLIFDSAHAFGSRFRQAYVGTFGDAEVFSLSPTKLLTAGEGGIIATNQDALAEKLRWARNYGNPGNYDCVFEGLSARMSEFNAALGLEALPSLEKNVKNRNVLAKHYQDCLQGTPGIGFQKVSRENRSTYKDFCILVDEKEFGLTRDCLHGALDAENIQCRQYFNPPLHQLNVYKNRYETVPLGLPVTEWASQHVLSLPLYSHMTRTEVEKICRVIKRIHYWCYKIHDIKRDRQ